MSGVAVQSRCSALFVRQLRMANPIRSMALWRGLLVLALIQCVSSVALIASAEAVPGSSSRVLNASVSSSGSIDLQSDKGFATILPLKSQGANASRSLMERNVRNLLGDAQMPLHDDLLSKGYYTSNLFIGTPAHEFALIVDTGSTVTYVPCSTCTHCGNHQDAAFKPADSSSYEAIPCTSPTCNTGLCGKDKQCKYERQYAESSTSAGVLGRDLFGFGDNTNLGTPKLLFGCENDETGDLFYQKADGIMGLGRGALSIVDQLVHEKDMADTFSLCYAGMDEEGGNMIMGDYSTPSAMVFTASDPNRSPYYNVVLKQIKVAGSPLNVEASVFDARYGTVLDSGTTYAYLPEKAFNEFKGSVVSEIKNLKPVAGPDPSYEDFCFQGAGSDLTKLSEYFPAVELVFGEGVTLPLEPENYLFKHTQVPGAYCLGVFKNENDHTTLLGGILVRNMLVKYDRANKQLGFWRTKCLDLWTRLDEALNSKYPPPPPPSPPPPPPPPPPVSEPPPPVEPEPVKDEPITDEHIGGLELNISVVANYSTFGTLSSGFVEDMTRDLQLEVHQVRLLGFQEQGSDVAVTCAVSPPSTKSKLPGSTVQDIIGRLRQHRVQFRSDFGTYHLNTWKLIHEERSSWAADHLRLVVGLVILFVTLASGTIALWSYRRARDRTHRVKYLSVDPLGDDASQHL